MFQDRADAGKKLGELILKKIPSVKNGIVLGLPRGGVVVAKEIAKKLNLPLDIIVTRKIGAPFNSEYAVAACGTNTIILNPKERVDKDFLEDKIQEERQEIQRRIKKYRGNDRLPNLKDKTVFLIDDGLATGLTMEAAINEVKYFKPKKIILAVPVAPTETFNRLKNKVNQIFVLFIEELFFAVGQFYQNFSEVSDKEVVNILSKAGR